MIPTDPDTHTARVSSSAPDSSPTPSGPPSAAVTRPRTVAILAFDGTQMLDVTGPAEVFDIADRMGGGGLYDVVVTSAHGGTCVSSAGLRFSTDAPSRDVAVIDTFVVPGTYDWRGALTQPGIGEALADGVRRSRRIAAVCGGSFLLGPTGVLDGRRVTTHWMFLDDLALAVPAAQVQRGPIFVADGPVLTSAGVTAGIDLALSMVESDHGADLARRVARYLVVFMQRPGGQTQFSVRMRAEPRSSSLRVVLDGVAQDPGGDHRLAALSRRAGFSERHLARLFMSELGVTPATYVAEVRLEAARVLLESSDAPLDVIADQCGLGSAETLRRSFSRAQGVSPHAYRARFRSTRPATARP